MSAPSFLDLRCANCGRENGLSVLASIWLRITAVGTEIENPKSFDAAYSQASITRCTCGLHGHLCEFEQ
jgi:hypothetical protein